MVIDSTHELHADLIRAYHVQGGRRIRFRNVTYQVIKDNDDLRFAPIQDSQFGYYEDMSSGRGLSNSSK